MTGAVDCTGAVPVVTGAVLVVTEAAIVLSRVAPVLESSPALPVGSEQKKQPL